MNVSYAHLRPLPVQSNPLSSTNTNEPSSTATEEGACKWRSIDSGICNVTPRDMLHHHQWGSLLYQITVLMLRRTFLPQNLIRNYMVHRHLPKHWRHTRRTFENRKMKKAQKVSQTIIQATKSTSRRWRILKLSYRCQNVGSRGCGGEEVAEDKMKFSAEGSHLEGQVTGSVDELDKISVRVRRLMHVSNHEKRRTQDARGSKKDYHSCRKIRTN